MKSILQEATTIAKAIDKAWQQAGQPREFTVKVLELNEKNFLGLTKNPAVISLIYSAASVKQSSDRRDSRRRTPRKTKPMTQRPDRSRSERDRSERSRQDSSRSTQRSTSDRSSRRGDDQSSRSSSRRTSQTDRPRATTKTSSVPDSWTPDLIKTIEDWLNEIMGIMKCSIPFNLNADNKVLTVTYESKVVDAVEEEGMLFASFSFLLIQSLKKKHKNKFKGFRLLLTSKRSD